MTPGTGPRPCRRKGASLPPARSIFIGPNGPWFPPPRAAFPSPCEILLGELLAVGWLPPAFRGCGPVGDPQAVAPAVCGLEQGELGAGVRPLAAGENLHRLGPAGQLVSAGALAQQRGQLGDVCFRLLGVLHLPSSKALHIEG